MVRNEDHRCVDVNRRVEGGRRSTLSIHSMSLFQCHCSHRNSRHKRERERKAYLLIQPIAELGDARLDLVKLATLLPSISFDDVHGNFVWVELKMCHEVIFCDERGGGVLVRVVGTREADDDPFPPAR